MFISKVSENQPVFSKCRLGEGRFQTLTTRELSKKKYESGNKNRPKKPRNLDYSSQKTRLKDFSRNPKVL